jgi:hypothetical protein
LTAEEVTALASVGALLVISATAIAGFIQLRHMRTTNQLTVLNTFREAYESPVITTARDAMPDARERLGNPESRRELTAGTTPEWARRVFPLMRLFETLGNYTNRNIVPRDLVCDLWSPVVVGNWNDCAPLIAVMRRRAGSALFENWEMLAVLSRRWIDEGRESYPKHLPRMELSDPWATEDGLSTEPGASHQ